MRIKRRKSKFEDKKLLGAFGILILLTVGIGISGIWQIQGLSQRLENLGKRNLKLEKAVLEMRINNTVYAMGIRNYVFWKVSRYLGAVPMAINLDSILKAGERFREQLKVYQSSAYLPQQQEWVKQVDVSFGELSALGSQIADLVKKIGIDKNEGTINNLLMAFENRLYRIDEFLDNTMGKENLREIEKQMERANSDKSAAILFLILVLASAVTISALIAFSVYRRSKQERRYRQELFSQMINLEEKERQNLSLTLHDQMGQDLSALKIYLGMLEQNLPNPSQEIKDRLEQAKKTISGLIDKSHNIAFLLRPPALDEIGLTESLEALLLDSKHLTGVNYTYQKPQGALHLSSTYSLLFYRIAQELLTNMAKHSRAKNVSLGLNKKQDCIEFFYEDDGVGFRYDEIMSRPRRRQEDKLKLGLAGLKERTQLLNGSMRIDTAPGKGMHASVELPL